MSTSDKRMRRIHHGPKGGRSAYSYQTAGARPRGGGKVPGAGGVLEIHKTSDDFVHPEVTLASQLDYRLATDRAAELARQAERARQARSVEAPETPSRLGRLVSRLTARSEQRELTLTPGGLERSPIAGGCLEVE